ncbi:hypothetical protein PAXINDRAFT_71269 [Paxillus involutus ATCC 200175]|nr:hypothetical protein PAXINDRAFT_71269 [Paxillus involutus ATCC 200175]
MPTFLRGATGYGVYFLVYEKLSISSLNAILYGAALWAVINPIDMIKSRTQTGGFSPSTGQKYDAVRDCVRNVWRTEGIGAFTRGLGPTIVW